MVSIFQMMSGGPLVVEWPHSLPLKHLFLVLVVESESGLKVMLLRSLTLICRARSLGGMQGLRKCFAPTNAQCRNVVEDDLQ